MEKRVIPVLEMSCAVCAATVEKTVRELAGVEEASVNFSANTLQPNIVFISICEEEPLVLGVSDCR